MKIFISQVSSHVILMHKLEHCRCFVMKVVVIIKSIDIHDFLIVNLEAKHLFPRVAVSLFLFYFTLVIEWDEKVFFINFI